jgi:hypothetical protein
MKRKLEWMTLALVGAIAADQIVLSQIRASYGNALLARGSYVAWWLLLWGQYVFIPVLILLVLGFSLVPRDVAKGVRFSVTQVLIDGGMLFVLVGMSRVADAASLVGTPMRETLLRPEVIFVVLAAAWIVVLVSRMRSDFYFRSLRTASGDGMSPADNAAQS